MKKKIMFLITLLVATILLVPNVFAAEAEPTVLVVGAETVVIANGVELTIVEPAEADKATYGAVIKYGDNKELKVPADAWVFGGTHNDDTNTVNSKITMEGGKLYAIVGGGLHKSKVGTATIVINGGELKSVYGGGVASIFFDAPTTEEKTHDYNGDAKTSTTIVETANITINGGSQTKYIYGGGMGYNYTGTTSITVNGGNQETAILTAGGANGYTEESTVEINDGNIGTVQSTNRGSVDVAEITVKGGKIDTLYAGGADNDNTVTGTIGSVDVAIEKGAVETLKVGTNGGPNKPASEAAEIEYNKDAVKNIDETKFDEESITKTVTVTFVVGDVSESGEVPFGTTLTEDDIKELEKNVKEEFEKEGYAFDNFYADEEFTKEFDLTAAFEENTTIYINFVQAREEDSTKNPETSDMNIYATIILSILAATGLGYTIKKRKFN